MQITYDASNPDLFHRQLAHFNVGRMAVAVPGEAWEDEIRNDLDYRLAEGHYIELLRARVGSLVPESVRAGIATVDAFGTWFESLNDIGPGQHHALFDWLAERASCDQMRWFLTQEAAGEAGFEDLLAYTQVKLPPRAKLECARNFWDEMGHGKPAATHGGMLDRMVTDLALSPTIDNTVWESLALGNTMLALASTRRYVYHSVGALGAIELTAPSRVAKVSGGMRRLGFDGRARAYFDLHAMLDVAHSRAWNREVILPLLEENPCCARFIAEGALMRLLCGQQCFDRYSAVLYVPSDDIDVLMAASSGVRFETRGIQSNARNGILES